MARIMDAIAIAFVVYVIIYLLRAFYNLAVRNLYKDKEE